jgi:hypothetical protein
MVGGYVHMLGRKQRYSDKHLALARAQSNVIRDREKHPSLHISIARSGSGREGIGSFLYRLGALIVDIHFASRLPQNRHGGRETHLDRKVICLPARSHVHAHFSPLSWFSHIVEHVNAPDARRAEERAHQREGREKDLPTR